MSPLTALTVVWIVVELLLLRRRGALTGPRPAPAGWWRRLLLLVAASRLIQYLRSAALASLVGVYALLLAVALASHSVPLLEGILSDLFAAVRWLDPSFPFDASFRLPRGTRISLHTDGPGFRAFQAYAWWIVSVAAFVAFVLRRLGHLALGEPEPVAAQGLFRRAWRLNAAGAVAVALLLVWTLGPGMSAAFERGGLPLWPRIGIAAMSAAVVLWTGTMALGAWSGLTAAESWLARRLSAGS